MLPMVVMVLGSIMAVKVAANTCGADTYPACTSSMPPVRLMTVITEGAMKASEMEHQRTSGPHQSL